MYKNINEFDFRDEFYRMGRQDEFSYDGFSALYNHLEELENDTDTPIELDVVALCGEFSEYESATVAMLDLFDSTGSNKEEALEYFRHNTNIIEFDGGIIVQSF